jgi:hypothetical protein
MGWIGWGLYAARRMSRSRRRKPFLYTNLLMHLLSSPGTQGRPAQSARKAVPAAKPPVNMVVPSGFLPQPSWQWTESDLDFYRYATEKWKVHTFEDWGVLVLPAGKDAAYNFFGIVQLHEGDDRGSLAHGLGAGGDIDPEVPLLLLFRKRDGYDEAFAAVQSWKLVQNLIEQDRPLLAAGKYPRATRPTR